MKLKKILAFLLTMALLVSSLTGVIPVSAEATTTLDVWDGTIATEYAGGSGTVTDPYLISTPEQLALMAIGTVYNETSITGKYYKLTTDIYLNDTDDANWKDNNPNKWVTAKTDSKYFFTGNFDGDGHTIKGIYCNGNFERMGLFPGIVGTVSVKNVMISDSYLYGTGDAGKYIGAFVGIMLRDPSTAKFENCYITESVYLNANHSVAGFVGYGACESITFVNCAAFAEVVNRSTQYTRYGSFVGALASGSREITYEHCIGNLVYTSYAQYVKSYTVSYCAVSGTADSTSGTKKYPTVISLENMKGEAAKSAMPALNWNLWKTTESYPVIDFEFFKKDNFVYSFEDWRGTKNADFSQTGMSFADVAKDGSKSLCYYLEATNYGIPRVSTLNESNRIAKAVSGKVYDLSFWYKVDGTPTNAGQFVVFTTKLGGATSDSYRKLQTLDNNIIFNSDTTDSGENGWVKATVRFQATLIDESHDYIAIGVKGIGTAAVDKKIYIDAVTVEEAKFNVGEAWSGFIAESFAGGTGTHADPYLIENAEQFAKAISNTSEPGKYYKLTSDIYLNDVSAENWTENSPKSWYDRALYGASGSGVFFEGNVDGAGHTIYGAYYNGTRNAGIFPKVKNTTIRNLRISDASLTTAASSSMGAIVGWGDDVVNIYNCGVEASVTVSADKGVSAFVGYGYPSVSIKNCYSLATFAGTGNKGAFFGEVWQEEGKNTREIYNSFAVGYPLIWDGSGEDPVAAVNCYATVADTEVITEGEITVLTEDAMQGVNALQNMSNLEGFYATEGYPAIKAIGELLGDVNGDWACNSTDITALRKLLLGVANVGLTDINGDGKDNLSDLVNLKKRCAQLAVNNDYYQLVWFDDFAGSTLNEANWTKTPCASYADDVFYTYDESNIKLSSGDLNLTSFKNSYYDPQGDTLYKRSEYLVPGSVHTENKMSYKYGYLEIRAKVPYKVGAWPAFWLRSSNAMGKNANAPYELEVDVFEVFGSADTMRANIHQHYLEDTDETDENGEPIKEHVDIQTTGSTINNQEAYTFTNAQNLYNEYHTYGFEWTEEKMSIYVDGTLVCTWNLDAESLAAYGLRPDATGFDTTLSVIFGNNLITSETDGFDASQMVESNEESLPTEYDIDWIRLYQKNDGLSKLYIG